MDFNMHGRKQTEFKSHPIAEKIEVIAKGTTIGLLGRWITWPLEKAYYDASSLANTQTYTQIYRDVFKPASLKQVNTIFFKTGFFQTVGKSASNMGVINYIEHYHGYLPPFEKGLLGATLCTPFETLLTSRGEYHKVQNFIKMQNGCSLPMQMSPWYTKDFARVMTASFVRIFWSGFVTFYGVYKTTEQIKPWFDKNTSESVMKAVGAFSASFLVQPINMPLINFQTYVLTNPSRPLKETVQGFFKEHTLKDMLRGSLGRSINRSAYYGLTFFLAEGLKKKERNGITMGNSGFKK